MLSSKLRACVALVTVFLAVSVSGESLNPYDLGPYDVLYKQYDLADTGLEKHLGVWAPNATGSFPIILFSGSLAGNVPAATSVITVLERVVSHGYIIVNPYKVISTPGDNYHINHIDPALDYLRPRLENDFKELGADEDFAVIWDQQILMGHSSGNHINVNYLKEHCGNFVASILLSPVDGTDPYGIAGDFTITPGQKLNYEMPSLVMMAGLDPVKGALLYPACAPAKFSNTRFYDAFSGNRWFTNASVYGHVDFFEPEFVGTIDLLNFCGTDKNTNKTVYQDFVAGSIVAFSKAVLEPEKYCDLLEYVEDPSAMIVETIVTRDVDEATRCQPAACKWTPIPPKTTTPPPPTPRHFPRHSVV